MDRPFERRQLLVGAGALLVAGGAWAAEPRHALADFSKVPLEPLVPLSVGAWAGSADPNVVPETVDASIQDGRTVTRQYLGAGLAPVMLIVAYHGPQSPDLKVHRPETCYSVAGFQGAEPAPLQTPLGPGASIPCVAFTARRAERTETVLYWTRVGDRFPQSLMAQRSDFFLEALRGLRADGLLVRISTIGEDRDASLRTLKTFAAALVAAASPQGRTLLLGSQAKRTA